MGYDMFITSCKIPTDEVIPDDKMLWYGCGWEVHNNIWKALFKFADTDKSADTCDSIKIDGDFSELGSIINTMCGAYANSGEMFKQLSEDWAIYRRLCGMPEYGFPDDWLEGIGKERRGIMRTTFFVDSEDDRINDLCDMLCGLCFDYGPETAIKLIYALTRNDEIWMCQSY